MTFIPLGKWFFLAGPFWLGPFGLAITKKFSWRWSPYKSMLGWKSVDILWLRVYWGREKQ